MRSIVADNQSLFKQVIHLVDGASRLSIAVAVGADGVNLSGTAIVLPQIKWNLDPASGKWNMVLQKQLCRLIADALIGRAA